MQMLERRLVGTRLWKWLICLAMLVAAAHLGLHPSMRWVMMLVAGAGSVVLLTRPPLGPVALIVAALVIPMEFGTGTEVALNAATLLVPALIVLWLVTMLVRKQLKVAASDANAPLLAFVVAALGSLLIGNVLWDITVPKSSHFWLVQLAQWAIIAFAAGAFWLAGNLIEDEIWLRRLTFTFLGLGGFLALARVVPGLSAVASRLSTAALNRAPFWMLLTALAGAQLLFNHRLLAKWRWSLALVFLAVVFYAFVHVRESASTWVGVGAALGALIWLRWPRFRWPVVVAVVALTASGLLTSAVWEFAGGEEEWITTGGSRLVLIERVIQVTMRNPITGLGPASYRPYANLEPLRYRRAYWVNPSISSHNNYVDLFAHMGIVGLALFFWFAAQLGRVGLRLHERFHRGFLAAYVNGVLAAGAGSLVIMLLADWILPFVYNIGFPGFQASVLVWLFLGGLVAIDNLPDSESDP